jgi:Uma2 family endonuclease
LINLQEKQVEIYCQGREKEVLNDPINLSGEEVLSGFVLNLQAI